MVAAVQAHGKVVRTVQVNRNHAVPEAVAEMLCRRNHRVVVKIAVDPDIHTHAAQAGKGAEAAVFVGAPAVNRVAVDAAVLGVVVNREPLRPISLGHADRVEKIAPDPFVKFGINDQLFFHDTPHSAPNTAMSRRSSSSG